MTELISRKAVMQALCREYNYRFQQGERGGLRLAWIEKAVNSVPDEEPKWNRLMMYLSELQLTYSPNWGANGCGDKKLYEFVTGLVDELHGWEDGAEMREPTFTNAICKAESKQISKDFAYCEDALGRAENAIGNLPSAQPEPCEDTISRKAAIDALERDIKFVEEEREKAITRPEKYHDRFVEASTQQIMGIAHALQAIEELPSIRQRRTCVNCGRTINNGGWYADGRTRCPIEEHYALPKDGYCHLWEKRNITDDDYPERREE